jgi:pyruvate,water dikinase
LGAIWRLLRGTPALVLDVLRSARRRWHDEFRPRYARLVDRWATPAPPERPAAELLDGVRDLLDGAARYYTAVQMIIPLAYLSELLFTAFYDRLVRRAGDPPASTFLLGFESLPIRAEQSLYDLAAWCRQQPDLAAALAATPSERVRDLLATETPPAGVAGERWHAWRQRFQAHLDRYGHMVYNLDFVNPVPADEPAPLMDALTFYLRGGGTDPRARQGRAAARRQEATAAVRDRLDAPRRAAFERLLRWAQEIAPVREDALADIGLAWPLMRRMLLELGQRLVVAGALARPADVFWLEHAELQALAAALDAGRANLDGRADAVERRKMVWRGQKRVIPPQLLPQRSWFRAFDGLMPARSDAQTGATIAGVGASQGAVTAPARVLGGPADFGQLQPGEVLVASITTPAWTSLFAMAAAVVTDVGGPLSHSSIVAREYGIPAVLGTGVATRRIRSGQLVRVDGDAGTVTLLDEAQTAIGSSPAPAARTGPSAATRRRQVAVVALLAGTAIGAVRWIRRRRTRGSR